MIVVTLPISKPHMPFSVADARKHKSSLTRPVQEKWARIANATRRSCLASGGTEASCDVRAIRIANSKCSPRKRPRMSLSDLEAGIASAKAEVVKLHARHAAWRAE